MPRPRPRPAPQIDPSSPVPLYHQIAEAIRARIRAGELAEGDVLEPLREAAEAWGVNLHTVRHAYTELARDGLVSIERKRGTRVTRSGRAGAKGRPRSSASLDTFIAEIASCASTEFGLSPEELASRLRAVPGATRPDVYVVECSEWECRSHVRELEDRFDISAAPFVLGEDHELPKGDILATHFHSNEICRRWPRRLDDIHFVSMEPDPNLLKELGVRRRKKPMAVVLCELDQVTADTLASDLESVAPDGVLLVRTRLVDDANEAIRLDGKDPILLSPRLWESLSDLARKNTRLHEVRYIFDAEELQRVADQLGWHRIV